MLGILFMKKNKLVLVLILSGFCVVGIVNVVNDCFII